MSRATGREEIVTESLGVGAWPSHHGDGWSREITIITLFLSKGITITRPSVVAAVGDGDPSTKAD